MRQDEKYLLINQGFAGKQRLMPFFNRENIEDLILAIQSARSAVVAMAFARISPAKSWRSPKKICQNTARTEPMHSMPSTSAAKNSRSAILSQSLQVV